MTMQASSSDATGNPAVGKSKNTSGLWRSSLKPVLRRWLYATKLGTARLFRGMVPVLDKVAPPLGGKMRQWHWIWQPTFSAKYIEKFYGKKVDPFKFDSNPYEAEKYGHTMSLLKHKTYRRALEIGASEGAFTRLLAGICDEVVAMDISAIAVERARERLRDFSNVKVVQASLPNQVPEGMFDLIVASDVLVYLPKDVLVESLRRIEGRLVPEGCLLALHYMGDFGQAMLGRDVHDLIKEHLNLGVTHDDMVFGEGPKAEKGFAVTVFCKHEAVL